MGALASHVYSKWVGCNLHARPLLATHRPRPFLRRQVRVLSGSWALDRLISWFISILPLSSDDGVHIPPPPKLILLAHQERSSQSTHTSTMRVCDAATALGSTWCTAA
jgi:hypothetical protein